MAINLRVLVPQSTTNYVKNSSPRYDTSGWNTVGSTLTRSLDRSRFSVASLKIVTAGAALHEGTFYRVSDLTGVPGTITASMYMRGAGKVRIRLIENPAGQEWASLPKTLNDDRWTRFEVSGNIGGSNDVRLYVETSDNSAIAVTFYADGAQMEFQAAATTYCDGEQPGCRWSGISFSSVSTRDAASRAGGRWVALAGPCRPNNDIYVTLLDGFGMEAIQSETQPWSNASGSFYQRSKAVDRVLQLAFTVKHENLTPDGSLPLGPLHELREQLIDIIKPDLTAGDEPFIIEYFDDVSSDKPLYLRAHYESGLDGSWDVRNQFVNSFSLRLLSVDPFWYEDDQEAQQFSVKQTYSSGASSYTLIGLINKQWKPIVSENGAHPGNNILAVARGPDGTIYVGGSFSASAGNFDSRIAKWDGKNYLPLGPSGITGGSVTGMAFGPDGYLYIVGDFTTAGGVAVGGIAKYNPATDTYSAVGTGVAPGVVIDCVCVAPNGQVYVGGAFAAIGGISAYGIARWDGTQWRTVGANSGVQDGAGGNGRVFTIINAGDGVTLYMGGRFVADKGATVTYNGVAQIDTNTNLISQMGYGVTVNTTTLRINSLVVGKDGIVYAGGCFSAEGSPGTAVLRNVAKWSGGNRWFPVGAGLGDGTTATTVTGLGINASNELYAVGTFSASGSTPITNAALLSSDVWKPLELSGFSSAQILNSLLMLPNGDLYFAGSGQTVDTPKENILNNIGTSIAYPLLYIKNTGVLKYIQNRISNQALYLNCPVYSGEEIFVDFAKGKIWSTVRGDLSYTILPGSEIRSIYLLPGINSIGVLMLNDVGGVVQVRYVPQHHSADAIVNAEAMQ